jgi:hypothetical protein
MKDSGSGCDALPLAAVRCEGSQPSSRLRRLGIVLLLDTPLASPHSKWAQSEQELFSSRCKQIPLAFVRYETRGAQFCEPSVEKAGVRFGSGLKQAEGHGMTVPKFPENSKCAPSTKQIEGHHDRPAGAGPAGRTAHLGSWCFTFHSKPASML